MLNNDLLAKALKVNTSITPEDEKEVDKIWKKNPWLAGRNQVYDELIAKRILERISVLVEKVDKL